VDSEQLTARCLVSVHSDIVQREQEIICKVPAVRQSALARHEDRGSHRSAKIAQKDEAPGGICLPLELHPRVANSRFKSETWATYR